MDRQSYYYQQMNENEQLAYRIICDGLHCHQSAIRVLLYPGMKSVSDIYYKVLYDHPVFFYVNQYNVSHSHQNCEWTLYPEYLYSGNEAKTMIAEMHNTVDKVLYKALEYREDPFKMEMFLHNSVVKSVAYDYESLKIKNYHRAHSIAGAFLDKKAVCEGIAKAFKLLCDSVGLPCIVVVGYADNKGEFTENTLHAWNLVKVCGQWYHVDPTWDVMDLTGSDGVHKERHFKFDYFNLTTADISVDHRPKDVIPSCTAHKDNYFYRTGKYAEDYEDMRRIIDQQIDSDRIRIRIDCQKRAAGLKGLKQKYLLSGDPKKLILDALQEVQRNRKLFYRYSYYFNERLGTMNLYKM